MLQRSNKENSFLLPKTPGGIMEGPVGKAFKSTVNNTIMKPAGKRLETGAPMQLCSTKKSVAFSTPTDKNGLKKALATPRTILGGKDKNVRQQTPGTITNTTLKGKQIQEDSISEWEAPSNTMTGRINGAPGTKSQTMVFVDQQEPKANEVENSHLDDEIEFIPDPVSPLPFTPFLSDDEGEDIFCNIVSPDKRDLSQQSRKEQIDYKALNMACRNPRYKVTNNDEDNILDGPLSNLLKVWNLDIDKLPETAGFQNTSPSKADSGRQGQTSIAQHNRTHVHSKPTTTPLNRIRVQPQMPLVSSRRIERSRANHPYQRISKTASQKPENSRIVNAERVPSYMKLTASTMAKSRDTTKSLAPKPTFISKANSRAPLSSRLHQKDQVRSFSNKPMNSIHSMARIVNSSQSVKPSSITASKPEETARKNSVDFNDFTDDFGSDLDLNLDQDLNIELDL